MFSSWNSYPKVYALGHRAVKELTDVPVYVQEKVDGSQISFGIDPDTKELKMRSKGADIVLDCPEGMFAKAVEEVRSIESYLILGWTYRGEYLQKPKHNALVYDRTPKKNIILFDINIGDQEFLTPDTVRMEAERLNMEAVPTFYEGIVTLEMIQDLLKTDSVLGGQKIEGVVLKPVGYSIFGEDKKVILGKFVSEAFKEVHHKAWGESNPVQSDVIALVAAGYRTPARWQKAIIHLREAGVACDSPKDIGLIMSGIITDVLAEEEEAIKAKLWSYAWPKIKRQLTFGFPEWFKEQLLTQQFDAPVGKLWEERDVTILPEDTFGVEDVVS